MGFIDPESTPNVAPYLPMKECYPDANKFLVDVATLGGAQFIVASFQINGPVALVTLRLWESKEPAWQCEMAIDDLKNAGGGSPDARRRLLDSLWESGIWGSKGTRAKKSRCPACGAEFPYEPPAMPSPSWLDKCPVCWSEMRHGGLV